MFQKIFVQKSQFVVLLVALSLIVACGSQKTDEKLADERLKRIETLIAESAYNSAKIEIDSIHQLFPRLVDKRRMAATFLDTIVRRESARTLAYCDSILPLKQREADSIQRNFRFEKDPVYQQVGNYVYKTQQTESNATRNYLKSYVDENADFYLISNYTGAKIQHISVKVSVGELFAQTDTLFTTDPSNHSFSDGGTYWEALTFKNEAEKGVAAFVAQFYNKPVKVTLLGAKNFVYSLSESDKKAIAETYHLWVVKKDIVFLQKEIQKAQIKIARINARNKN